MIPELAYTWGVIATKYEKAQRLPKFALHCFFPIAYNVHNVKIPIIAFGKRAANSIEISDYPENESKAMKLKACNHKNKGGFSQKGWKLIWTLKKSPVTIISRADSAKFTSSQSNKCVDPKNGMYTAAPMKAQKRYGLL